MHSFLDLGRGSNFQKQCQSFRQIGARLLNRTALARDIELRAMRNEPVTLAKNSSGETPLLDQARILACLKQG